VYRLVEDKTMSRRVASTLLDPKVGFLLLLLLGSSCADVEHFSRRAGQAACASFDQCTVYDDAGEHEVACFDVGGDESRVFAGESGWPLSTASCPARASVAPSAR
jgi:hypothetical protein